MFQPLQQPAPPPDGFRVPPGRRALGILLALGLEALLFLILLTLGQRQPPPPPPPEAVSVVRLTSPPAQQSRTDPARSEEEAQQPERPSPPQPAPAAPRPPEPVEAPPIPQARPEIRTPSLIPLSREQMAAADIASVPVRRPAPSAISGPKMGPVDTGRAGDTPRVEGSGPNGEPLYAASWYREPRDDELRGYLSTAQGPGWGLIACRTVADFRVEDCIGIDEYPSGSNMMRAVLAAAWQFRVRPPRLAGRPQVGEWVRIRIDYDIVRR